MDREEGDFIKYNVRSCGIVIHTQEIKNREEVFSNRLYNECATLTLRSICQHKTQQNYNTKILHSYFEDHELSNHLTIKPLANF